MILPHALAYNAGADGLAALNLGANPALALHLFAARLGAPLALRDLGLKEADLDRAADIALQAAYWNPRPLTRPALRALLGRAWAGDPPEPPSETQHA